MASYVAATEDLLIVVLAILLALLMSTEVILRYWLQMPFLGIEETSILIGLWFYFLGVIRVTRNRFHIKGGIVNQFLKTEKALAAHRIFSTSLCLAACTVFSVLAISYLSETVSSGRTSIFLGWPTALWVASMTVGFVSTTLYLFAQLICELGDLPAARLDKSEQSAD